MAGEIIRVGDRTSHGGTVLEGSPTDICMGKPIAFIGHKTLCPKCKGTFPIVDGVLTTTFYGKGVAVAGMKTSCGAVLIASQFTDIVGWSSGSSGKPSKTSERHATTSGTSTHTDQNSSMPIAGGIHAASEEFEIEQYYSLTDGQGNSLPHYRYDLFVDGALYTQARTYSSGQTAATTRNSHTRLVTWLSKDSASKT